MTAQPIHQEPDPRDPEVILAKLPERVRGVFLEEYQVAVDAAHKPVGYRKLQQMLQTWSVRAMAYSKPDFFDRAEQARAGRGEYFTMEEVLARYQRHHVG